MEMSDKQYRAEMDVTYRAIGRYVVAFSQLIAHMRRLIARHLTDDTTHPRASVEMLLGDVGPRNVADAFFNLCRTAGGLTGDEVLVSARLQKRVMEANELRTDVAHGDWTVGEFEGSDADRMLPPEILRIKASRKDQPAAVAVPIEPDELNTVTDDIWTLTMLVLDFGKLALHLPFWVWKDEPEGRFLMQPGPDDTIRVGDVYRNEGTAGKVVIGRTGERANDVALMRYAGMDGRWNNAADMEAVAAHSGGSNHAQVSSLTRPLRGIRFHPGRQPPAPATPSARPRLDPRSPTTLEGAPKDRGVAGWPPVAPQRPLHTSH